MDRILKNVEVGKFITTALKSVLKLVKLQNLVAKCSKMRKIYIALQSLRILYTFVLRTEN